MAEAEAVFAARHAKLEKEGRLKPSKSSAKKKKKKKKEQDDVSGAYSVVSDIEVFGLQEHVDAPVQGNNSLDSYDELLTAPDDFVQDRTNNVDILSPGPDQSAAPVEEHKEDVTEQDTIILDDSAVSADQLVFGSDPPVETPQPDIVEPTEAAGDPPCPTTDEWQSMSIDEKMDFIKKQPHTMYSEAEETKDLRNLIQEFHDLREEEERALQDEAARGESPETTAAEAPASTPVKTEPADNEGERLKGSPCLAKDKSIKLSSFYGKTYIYSRFQRYARPPTAEPPISPTVDHLMKNVCRSLLAGTLEQPKGKI